MRSCGCRRRQAVVGRPDRRCRRRGTTRSRAAAADRRLGQGAAARRRSRAGHGCGSRWNLPWLSTMEMDFSLQCKVMALKDKIVSDREDRARSFGTYARRRERFHRCVAAPNRRFYKARPQRRGAGAVDRGGLENRCTPRGTRGSNPCLSAKLSMLARISVTAQVLAAFCDRVLAGLGVRWVARMRPEILVDMTSAGRFEGVGGSRCARPSLERRPDCVAAGARSPHCRVGAPSWVEQQQQRQAAIQRRTEEAAAGQQSAGTFWQEARWAEGPSGRDAAPERDAGCDHRPLSADLCRVRCAADRGDGDRLCRPAGVRSARAAAAGRHRASRPWLPLCGLRQADTCGLPRLGDRAGAVRQTDRRLRALSAALPVAAGEASGRR